MQTTASQEVFNEAIEYLNTGKAQKAIDLCLRAIERNNEDVNMIALLGAIYLQINDIEKAERNLKQAIDLAPTFAKPYEDLGILMVTEERFDEALSYLEKAVRLDPSLADAYFNLGKTLANLGRGREADKAYEQAFNLSPERKAMAKAAKAQKEGKLDDAEKGYRQVLKKNPNNVDALRFLSQIASTQNHYDDAERFLKKAIKLAPDFLLAVMDLGKLYKDQNRYAEAITQFRHAISIAPNRPMPYMQLASTLAPIAELDEAIAMYKKCLELAPNHPGALLNLGHNLKTIGQLQEGIAAYEKCIEVLPSSGETYWSLANLKTYKFTDPQIETMISESKKEDLNPVSRVNFLFALGKAHDDRKEYNKAWHYYQLGNSEQRNLINYDPVHTEVTNDRIIQTFNAENINTLSQNGNSDPAPIFIVGLPRSGSTLLEQIIASHSMVEGTAELPYLNRTALSLNKNRIDGVNYPEAVMELQERHLKKLGQDYLDAAQTHRLENKPYFIDKMPNNFPHLGFLHCILPNAKIIDARRNPMDACVGNLRQLYANGQTFSYDQTDIGEYYLQYQRLMDHWHEVMPGKILTCQYEETVADLEGQVRRILDYLELPWEDACLNFHNTDRAIRTPSSEQVRQPIYTRSIGKWRRYESELGELKEVLEDILPRYEKYLG
ncbi:sulfotransferase [Dasania sp. GY-MA-18]|uniref:Sulfotransferase n=1 Tax=Dasania phycosphaerae TaxID=2950436 RepID=A0A9J6RN28_9GAMM|nr:MULTISPECIES: tetratricopeptide repeat-containing sulfotransferase family protein [Dasania]MCR8923160.1 sulfotransferase [Dasania sp. GY-MA-18]MCZ0865592.1 sulfotransferase [Dasania phycosphaerae]MCZ0869317.1 sulfotransferase [Dasania phycosphaerae]